jgi:hypothetical protein
LVTVYFLGHLSDLFGRVRSLAAACIAISTSLLLYGSVEGVGFDWGLTYSLGPIVLTRLVRQDERVQLLKQLSTFVLAGFGLVLGVKGKVTTSFDQTGICFSASFWSV